MLAKIRLYGNLGPLNPNILLVIAYIYNIPNFRIASYSKFGNGGNTWPGLQRSGYSEWLLSNIWLDSREYNICI